MPSNKKQGSANKGMHAEFKRLRQDMVEVGERIDVVEKERDNLRCVNKVLFEKLKKAKQNDETAQVFFYKLKFEKEHEISMLAAQKFVTKQSSSKILYDLFAKLSSCSPEEEVARNLIDRDDGISGIQGLKLHLYKKVDEVKMNNEKLIESNKTLKREVAKLREESRELIEKEQATSIAYQLIGESLEESMQMERDAENTMHQIELEVLRKEHENESELLKKSIVDATQNQKNLLEEIGKLKRTNEDLMANEVIKCLSHEAINASLEEIIEEDIRAKDKELQRLMAELKAANEDNSWKNKHLLELTQRAEATEEKLAEQQKLVENKDKMIKQEIEKSSAIERKASQLDKNVTALKDKIEETQRALTASENKCQSLLFYLDEFSRELRQRKLTVELLQIECQSKDEEISRHKREKRVLETTILELRQQNTTFQSDIETFDTKKNEFEIQISSLKEKTESMDKKMHKITDELKEEKKLKYASEDEMRTLLDKNEELNDVINGLKLKMRRKRWWRRMVSCS